MVPTVRLLPASGATEVLSRRSAPLRRGRAGVGGWLPLLLRSVRSVRSLAGKTKMWKSMRQETDFRARARPAPPATWPTPGGAATARRSGKGKQPRRRGNRTGRPAARRFARLAGVLGEKRAEQKSLCAHNATIDWPGAQILITNWFRVVKAWKRGLRGVERPKNQWLRSTASGPPHRSRRSRRSTGRKTSAPLPKTALFWADKPRGKTSKKQTQQHTRTECWGQSRGVV